MKPKQSTLLVSLLVTAAAAAQSPVPAGAKAEKVVSGFQFVEGPVWSPDGTLLFSDIPANTVYRLNPDKSTEVFLKPSGNSNGLLLDARNRLLLAQHGDRRVARLESDGTQTVLASHFEGKRLNSPNDLCIGRDGAVYFTDPPYGVDASKEELHYYGIFRIAPDGGLSLLDKSVRRPNGIALSPDEGTLYVDDSEACRVYAWDLAADGTASNKRLLASPSGSVVDGMKVDREGRLYISGSAGVSIYGPDGGYIDRIPVAETGTNCGWGGENRDTLYITAGRSVYRIRLNATGSAVPEIPRAEGLALLPNYPNPFNPETRLSFTLDRALPVLLTVFDCLGRPVRPLASSAFGPGTHSVTWDGLDSRGLSVPAGV